MSQFSSIHYTTSVRKALFNSVLWFTKHEERTKRKWEVPVKIVHLTRAVELRNMQSNMSWQRSCDDLLGELALDRRHRK